MHADGEIEKIPLPIKKDKSKNEEIFTISNYLSSIIYWKVLKHVKSKIKN